MIKRLFCLLLVLALLGCSTGLTAFSEADPPVGEEVQQIINEEPTVNEPEQPASESAPEQPAADPAPQAPAAPTQEQQPAADSENETPADNVTAPEIDETPAADEMTPVESTTPNVEEPPAAEETPAAVETPEAADETAAADATEEPAVIAAPTDTPAPTEDPYKGMVDPSTNKDDYTKGVWLHVVHGGFKGKFKNADDPNVTQEYDVSNFASVWVDFNAGTRVLPTTVPNPNGGTFQVKGLNGGIFQGWYTKAPTERQVSGGEGANSYFYYEITHNGDKIEPGTTSVPVGTQVLYAVFTYPAPQEQQQDQQRITFRYNWNGMHGYYSSALTHETTRSNGTFKAGDAIVSFVNMNNDLLGKYNELTKAGTSGWEALKKIWSKDEVKNDFDGYRFLGWSLTAQASPEEYIWSDTVIPNDAIFYAQWEKIGGADVSSGTQGREVGAEIKVTALSLSAEKTTLDPTNANGQWWKSEKSEVATTSWLDDVDTYTTLTLTATPQNGDVTGVEWYVKVGDGEFKPLSDYDNSVFTCMKKGNQFILAAGANTDDGQTVSVKAKVGEVESDEVTITFKHNMEESLNDAGVPVSVCSVCGLEVELPADEAPADDMGLLSDAAPAPTEDPYQGMRDPSTNADDYTKGVWLHVIHGGFTGTFKNEKDEKNPTSYNISNFASVWVDFTDGTRQLPKTLPTVKGLNGGTFKGWYTGAPKEEKVTVGSGTDGYFYYQITANGTKIEPGQNEVPSGTQVLYAVYEYREPTQDNQKRVTYRYNWNGMNGDYWSLIQETTRANDTFKASDAIVSSKNWNDNLGKAYKEKGSSWDALKEIWTKGNPDNDFNGYHFLGWSLNDPTGKQVINQDTKIPNDAVFYAVWEKGDSSSATEGRSIYPEAGPVKEIYIAAQGSQTFYMDAGKTESVAVPVLVTPVGGTGEITWTVEVLRSISDLGDYFKEPIEGDPMSFTADTVDQELQKHNANFKARVSGLTLIITPNEGFTQGLLVSASCNDATTPTKAKIVIKHTPSDAASVVTPATCTHNGEEEIVCVECGAVTETTEIPPTGHMYQVEKTGVEDGVAVYTKACISGDDTMTVKAGDANGDNVISNKDINLIYKSISKQDNAPVDIVVCDVNKDGKISNKDINDLFKFISRQTDILG